MKELDVERYLKKQIELIGGLCLKWVSPGNAGVPDRIILLPNGQVIFAEIKNGNKGRLSTLQKRMLTVLKTFKMRTYVLRTKEEIDVLIQELKVEL